MSSTLGPRTLRSNRLKPGDRDFARKLFDTIAEVFDEDRATLADAYIDRLLAREDFWAIAAWVDDQIVGGLTAHILPMTRTASSEVFIYDIAVRRDHRRKGVGRHLMTELRESAAAQGITVVFFAADNDDPDALDFYRALRGDAFAGDDIYFRAWRGMIREWHTLHNQFS